MKEMPLVSVVIPAYNAEDTIKECVASVCSQSYQNIEILIINDGSTDMTQMILDSISQRDSRIIVRQIENQGVSNARNTGIGNSRGEYVTFVDSDDIISYDYVAVLVNNMIEYDVDMSSVGMVKSSTYSDMLFSDNDTIVYRGEEVYEELFNSYEGFVCGKLYKTYLIVSNDINFEQDIKMCEDLVFNIRYLLCCKTVSFNPGKKYYYRQSSNSTINRLDSIVWFDSLCAYKIAIKLLEEHKNAQIEAIANLGMHTCEGIYRVKYARTLDDEIKILISDCTRIVKKRFLNFSFEKKIKIILFRMFPRAVMWYRRRGIK